MILSDIAVRRPVTTGVFFSALALLGVISWLRLPRTSSQTLRDTISLKRELPSLDKAELTPSAIYRLLYGYSPQAITANSLASESPLVHQHIQLFMEKLRYIRPALTGNDLQKMGIAPGPRMKEILHQLHQARLDGRVTSKKGEAEMVKSLLTVSS